MTDPDLELRRRASAHLVVDYIEVPTLSREAEHHLLRVLRLTDGETVTVTDGQGSWRPCVVAGNALVPTGSARFVARSETPLTVAFAVPKADRPEWIVQKLTELGVERIVLLHAERSVVRWKADRADRQRAKLRRVAIEAVQQSRRVWLPAVEGPLPASTVLPTAVVAEPGGRSLTADDRVIAIGPEGGWSPDELALAAGSVGLADGVLRVETAALAVAVLAGSCAT